MASMALRAELSRRIRGLSPADWREFSELWTAFNAIYGGEPDRRERARVMRCLRESFSAAAALRVLRATTPSITRILDIPPGDMRRDRTDPNFRAASQKYAAVYRTPKESSAARLAAVGTILYQVRCNLVHGSKDPANPRDRMLVTESLAVLGVLVPALEDQLT